MSTLDTSRPAILQTILTSLRDWEGAGQALIISGPYDAEEDALNVNGIIRVGELADALAPMLAAAWQSGRESLALDMGKPLDEHGMRPATPNPYDE